MVSSDQPTITLFSAPIPSKIGEVVSVKEQRGGNSSPKKSSANSSTIRGYSPKLLDRQTQYICHERGYLWGRSKFHFSNYRIQVYYWSLLFILLVFLVCIWTFKNDQFKEYNLYPGIWFALFGITASTNLFLFVDWLSLYREDLTNSIDLIPLTTNFLYWVSQGYGFYDNLSQVYIIGLIFLFSDLIICVYVLTTYERLHLSYSGPIELIFSLMRCLLMMKTTQVVDYYWTFILFPATAFSIFSTALFFTLLIQASITELNKLRIINAYSAEAMAGKYYLTPNIIFDCY